LWSEDGNQVIVVGSAVSPPVYGDIWIYNTSTWDSDRSGGFDRPIRELAPRPQGSIIVGITWDSLIASFDIEGGKLLQTHSLHSAGANLASWRPDGTEIATVNTDGFETGSLRFWSLPASDLLPRLAVEQIGNVTKINWDEEGTSLIIEVTNVANFGLFYSLDVVNVETGETEKTLFRYGDQAFPYFLPNWSLTRIAQSYDNKPSIQILDSKTLEVLLTLSSQSWQDIEWSHDDKIISVATKAENANLQMWDATNGILEATFDLSIPLDSLAWSPDDTRILLTTYRTDDSVFQIFDVETGKITATITLSGKMIWSSESHLLAAYEYDSKDVTFWDGTTGELIERIASVGLTPLAFSSDNNRLALSSADGTIRIWDVSDLN
jgi:WD40 repeat protein